MEGRMRPELRRQRPDQITWSGPLPYLLVARGGVEPPTYRFSGGRSFVSTVAVPSKSGASVAWRLWACFGAPGTKCRGVSRGAGG